MMAYLHYPDFTNWISFLAIFGVSWRQKLSHYKGRGIESRCSEDLIPFRAF